MILSTIRGFHFKRIDFLQTLPINNPELQSFSLKEVVNEVHLLIIEKVDKRLSHNIRISSN